MRYIDEERNDIHTVILCDSMLRHCNFKPFGVKYGIGGATAQTFIDEFDSLVSNWNHYNLCIIHLGTNNISKDTARYVLPEIKSLTRLIQRENPNIKVLISGILPRPVDHSWTGNVVTRVNTALKIWTKSTPGVGFYPTYRSFTSNFDIREDQNHFDRDRLHLNKDEGSGRMERLMKQQIRLFQQGRSAVLR